MERAAVMLEDIPAKIYKANQWLYCGKLASM